MSKEEYISMSKFMFMQICQQAEMSLHLSQYNDTDRINTNRKNITPRREP